MDKPEVGNLYYVLDGTTVTRMILHCIQRQKFIEDEIVTYFFSNNASAVNDVSQAAAYDLYQVFDTLDSAAEALEFVKAGNKLQDFVPAKVPGPIALPKAQEFHIVVPKPVYNCDKKIGVFSDEFKHATHSWFFQPELTEAVLRDLVKQDMFDSATHAVRFPFYDRNRPQAQGGDTPVYAEEWKFDRTILRQKFAHVANIPATYWDKLSFGFNVKERTATLSYLSTNRNLSFER